MIQLRGEAGTVDWYFHVGEQLGAQSESLECLACKQCEYEDVRPGRCLINTAVQCVQFTCISALCMPHVFER